LTANDVIDVIGRLERAGLRYWLDGGWGVDALAGEQTRDHDDVDVVVELSEVDAIIEALRDLGFEPSVDERPTRLVLADAGGRGIDLHPIVLDVDGNGRQIGAGPGGADAFYPAAGLAGEGSVSGRAVRCLTPRLLLLHHTGYSPKPKDHHNVRVLCERFGLIPPVPYPGH
jgi:lincosamide nucleotidyltransferase A/C/D/E